MKDHVILVDQADVMTGAMEKMEAHERGELHRAFSIFIFNQKGEFLLQQRALDKYHSGGLWSNTCCSHPYPGEETAIGAKRRLQEEMGMDCVLDFGFSFIYQADLEDGLSENEFDHVYFGSSDQTPVLNPEEVAAFKYVTLEALETALKTNPEEYTIWLKICFERVKKYHHQLFNL
ncbi:isopentenyl-diphosphate Delta-isomerase [Pedobacter cryoconitis]|uniref:Isopentenyl-diphosphate delta-isomerase n=1 Tax=Pedobacter cryoconitis TaxID=188932 RepID=A0A327SUJ0_9SPHI|nr:isopentenyl-diphosphate Delta-isomerase [Pedobacter cryoconitis]RAJ32996.1 isopentenyl-diphosphate delta-isomerase [Pedobacter cryoconitis]